jgi:hypothetical protein
LTATIANTCLQTKQARKQHDQQPHLPLEVLRLVLQRIKQRERLRSCSLVCQAWRAAAAATVTTISTSLQRERSSRSLRQWLCRHGGNVMHLSVQNKYELDRQLVLLPLAQLTQLRSCKLSSCELWPAATSPGNVQHALKSSQPHGSSSSSNPLSCLSSLTLLEMKHVTLCGFASGLQSLSALTALQDLTVYTLAAGPCRAGRLKLPAQPVTPCEQLCLRQLTQLTRLATARNTLLGTVAPLCHLQQLQHLELGDFIDHTEAAVLLGLPMSLTYLSFGWASRHNVSIIVLPALASLTALRSLSVLSSGTNSSSSSSYGGFQPDLLSRMLQLQRLQIGQLSSNALPELLQVMKQLSSLQLLDLGCGGVEPLPPSAAAR